MWLLSSVSLGIQPPTWVDDFKIPRPPWGQYGPKLGANIPKFSVKYLYNSCYHSDCASDFEPPSVSVVSGNTEVWWSWWIKGVLSGSRIHRPEGLRTLPYTIQGAPRHLPWELVDLRLSEELVWLGDRIFNSFSLPCRNCFVLHHNSTGRHVPALSRLLTAVLDGAAPCAPFRAG